MASTEEEYNDFILMCRYCRLKEAISEYECQTCHMVTFCSHECMEKYMMLGNHNYEFCDNIKDKDEILKYIRQLLLSISVFNNIRTHDSTTLNVKMTKLKDDKISLIIDTGKLTHMKDIRDRKDIIIFPEPIETYDEILDDPLSFYIIKKISGRIPGTYYTMFLMYEKLPEEMISSIRETERADNLYWIKEISYLSDILCNNNFFIAIINDYRSE